MPNDSSGQPTSPAHMESTGLTAVLAHSMLGAASAIGAAIAMAMADEPSTTSRHSMLQLAMTRLQLLTAQLQDLAAGVPASLVPTVDPAGKHGESIVEDGTPIELYSAFDQTWSAGFEIASAAEVGYRVRRDSDGSLLPGYTSRADIRVLSLRSQHNTQQH